MINSLELILDATMVVVRVCLGQFEVLPWMASNATKWKKKANNPISNPPETWLSFKGWCGHQHS